MSAEHPYVVIAASEDTIVLNDSIEFTPIEYYQWEPIPINIVTPKLEGKYLTTRYINGSVIHPHPNDFLKKIVPGSLVTCSSSSIERLYKDLYRSGALNLSIQRVMRAFNVNDYELPVPQGSLYTKLTHERDDYFSIPGQEQD